MINDRAAMENERRELLKQLALDSAAMANGRTTGGSGIDNVGNRVHRNMDRLKRLNEILDQHGAVREADPFKGRGYTDEETKRHPHSKPITHDNLRYHSP